MKIVTFAKHVPSSAVTPRIADAGDRIEVDGLSYEVSEADLYALEEAVHQRSVHGGSVTAVTVGPSKARDALYLAYAKGVDHAVHVGDEIFRGTNARVSVNAAREIVRKQGFDLIFTGIQAEDDLRGGFGVALAEELDIPVITSVTEIRADPQNGRATVIRELGAGFKQEIEVEFPCLLTIQFGIRPLRYVPVMAIVRARSRKIESTSVETMMDRPGHLQPDGRFRVVRLSYPERNTRCEMIAGSPDEIARTLAGRLTRSEEA